MITHNDLRQKFKTFFEERGHKEVPPAPLAVFGDSTSLFTSSGMQQLVPNLMGEIHPLGKRLWNIQPSFRTQDIEEVGDNRHMTFFEMMGNWSLGDYFKDEQLAWCWEFFTNTLSLPKERLYVTVFEGNGEVKKDTTSLELWKKLGVKEDHIFQYGAEKNWWSRSGTPDSMPEGEIGGPDSEVFYDFGIPHDKKFGEICHPNCDCGRFLEIGNSVFIEYKKGSHGTLEELPQKNVDFGGGLERILAAVNNNPDIFTTDVFQPIIAEIEKDLGKSYVDREHQPAMRVIADHLKAAVFLIINGVRPSNKEQGYILRKLLRRSAVKMHQLKGGLTPNFDSICDRGILFVYDGAQGIERAAQKETVFSVVNEEMGRFAHSLDKGLKEIQKMETVHGKAAFDLYQTHGFPLEITEELLRQKGQHIDRNEFYAEFEKHKRLSKTASGGMFKGGLADHSEQTIKYHTATHLLHQALFDVLGNDVRQEGSNITGERLRFDFSSSRKPTNEEIQKVQYIINEKIKESLPVEFKIMPKEQAFKIGAKSFFRETYTDMVKVYFVGEYSKEVCGGPHVKNTSSIGQITVYKLEKRGNNLYRIYAK